MIPAARTVDVGKRSFECTVSVHSQSREHRPACCAELSGMDVVNLCMDLGGVEGYPDPLGISGATLRVGHC